MSLKANMSSRSAKVILFLLLNSLLVAAPVVHGSSGDKEEPVGYLTSKETSEHKETHQLKNAEEQFLHQYTARKKKAHRFINNEIFGSPVPILTISDKLPHGSLSASFPYRPEYYRLLFLYQLF